MKELLGTIITAMLIDENGENYLVQKDGITFQVAKDEFEKPLAIGEMIEGFVYENSTHDLRLTTNIPQIRVGHYAFGDVTDVRKDLGVFVDIGLSDKEMVVSLDLLPSIKELWPKKGDRLMIALEADSKNRLWGIPAEESIFRSISKQGKEEMKNQDITGTVFRLKIVGTYLLTDDFYLGFVHPNERLQEPRMGEVVKGRVIGVRQDGVLNISLKPRAYEAISDDAQMILAMLERNQAHELPFWDKSDPEAIKAYFGISKGQFKRAVGHLLKEHLIKQEEGHLFLIDNLNK